jgi:hypothetical protein
MPDIFGGFREMGKVDTIKNVLGTAWNGLSGFCKKFINNETPNQSFTNYTKPAERQVRDESSDIPASQTQPTK